MQKRATQDIVLSKYRPQDWSDMTGCAKALHPVWKLWNGELSSIASEDGFIYFKHYISLNCYRKKVWNVLTLISSKKKGKMTEETVNLHNTVIFRSWRGFSIEYVGSLLPICGRFVSWRFHLVKHVPHMATRHLKSSPHTLPFARNPNLQNSDKL